MKYLEKKCYLNMFWFASLFLIMVSCMSVTQDRCGTMQGYQERLDTDSTFARNEDQLEKTIGEYIKKMRAGKFTEFRSGKVVIPVVVHVVYNGNNENISDGQIQSQIDILNEDFRRLNLDITNVPTDFQAVVADARLEFKLAQRDPNCNPTTGITRTSTTITSFTYDNSLTTATVRNPVKFNSSGGADGWPSDEYLNIWVCNLDGFLGYGSFPSDLASRPSEDGVVIDFEAFGNTGTAVAPYNQGRTATHEIGHWLNLRHIWGDDDDPISTNICSGTDFVDDTPNQGARYFGCPTHPQTSCGSDDMFMNYMDYVDDNCAIMFSNGQSDRMDAVLYTTRLGIVSSQGALPPASIAEDLFSRDMMDDIGEEPNTTSAYMYKSDDIWIRNVNDGFTNQEHQNPIGGSTNYVYVRIRNRGCGIASGGNVKLYWAKASSGLSWPAPWDGSVTSPALMGSLIGTQPSGSVAASDYVVLEYHWTAPIPANYSSFGADKAHFCLLSRIETSSTSPYGMTTPETSDLVRNVRNNNNIVWKNVTVTEPNAGGRMASALISNYDSVPMKYNIVFEVPEGEPSIFDYGNVIILLDDSIYNSWTSTGMAGENIEIGKNNEVFLLNSRAKLNDINLNPKHGGIVEIRVTLNQKKINYARNVFKLEMLQYQTDGNKFIGGQTFLVRTGN